MTDPLVMGLLIAGLLVIDGLARPSEMAVARLRSWRGTGVLLGSSAFVLGNLLYLTGAWMPSLLMVLALAGSLTLASNIKRQVLGEPLVFSDFALVGAIFQHPHFYLSALRPWQLVMIAGGILILATIIVMFSSGDAGLRFTGLGIAVAAGLWLGCMVYLPQWRILAQEPDLDRDVLEHGLVATLVVYWHLWGRLPVLADCTSPPIYGEPQQLVVVVQCESFADPTALFGAESQALPGLTRAQALAWRSGRLMVSGFGAYTMRTEFGVLFGIPESKLGLRRFDPFLTAAAAASWSLPNRIGGKAWSMTFVHPHDMRFYGRDKLMPAAGFDELVGEDAFAQPAPADGRFVKDEALCDKLLELAASAEGSSLIYAVTIENHGPWSADGGKGAEGNKAGYLRLLLRSDAMLSRLIEELPKLGRPITLCFFGDHRPSIPFVSTPGGDRHTPYVIVRFDASGTPITSSDRGKDLTPAGLHGAMLEAIGSGRGQ